MFGEIYVILIVITFSILLMNLMLAILANTYNIFETKSNGLYLSKILSTRDELTYDYSYGAFLSAMPPLNIIQFGFIPMSLYLRYGSPMLVKLNRVVMRTQYTLFMLLPFTLFVVVSLILIPFAWMAGIPDKVKAIIYTDVGIKEKILNSVLFIVIGPIILFFDLIVDMVYFWIYNYRRNLQKIIIEKEKSTVSHRSLKEIIHICNKYSNKKIKTTHTS